MDVQGAYQSKMAVSGPGSETNVGDPPPKCARLAVAPAGE
jgi:hypothetical protein